MKLNMGYDIIKDKKPIDIVTDPENIFLNSFIHYYIMEAPFTEKDIIDYKKMHSAYMLLIKIFMEYGQEIKIDLNKKYYDDALKKKMIKGKFPKPVWAIECNGKIGYGNSLPEAICKLSIILKYDLEV